MKVLFIGGTGNISTSTSRLLVERGYQLTLLNRGKRSSDFPGAETVVADVKDPDSVRAALGDRTFDAVVNWVAFRTPDIERDLSLFEGKCGQYVFISSASVYQKPPAHPVITESTPLANPYWQYSRDKIACEEMLVAAYRERRTPITIVRPSHTYDFGVPTPVGGYSDWQFIQRVRAGKPVVVHGDGATIWPITHSEDFSRGFIPLLGNPAAIGNAFHITSDELLTWNQIHDILFAAIGAEAPIVHVTSDRICKAFPQHEGSLLGDKSHSIIFDNTKIRRLSPDFICRIPLAVGLRRTIARIDADPKYQTHREGGDEHLDALAALGND